ncbi:MAG: flagellar hook-basal body complex protein FliE [Deltaproteobacteria bacterium]|nr:flagellar hook-basal body complex protein FliE [Deltaproteobacteria bacterium]MBI4794801.1 flagellar hook-basal body complex protein FliE [Deltaproteobacteria bacterium]
MKITAPNPGLVSPQGSQGLEAPAPKKEFGNVLNEMVGEINRLQQDGDQKISGSLVGREDLHEAMLSLEKANLSLKVLIQVRNKMIQAYEELSRMPL